MTSELSFAPASVFVLRTPLLPFDEVLAWSSGLEAPAALATGADLEAAVRADRTGLRARLAALLDRPEIREALLLASPDLVAGLATWAEAPGNTAECKKARRLEGALVRYFVRMASRPTPFGLFAGCATGEVAASTRFAVAPTSACRRHTRLDMDYLDQLCRRLAALPSLRRELRVRTNTSLARVGGRLRFAAVRLQDRARSHHLVALDPSEAVELVLEVARRGSTSRELAQRLVEMDSDGEIALEEAEAFVDELLEQQVLVPELEPRLSGEEPLEELIAQLRALPAGEPFARVLEESRLGLEELDAAGLGAPPAPYQRLAAGLEPLGGPVEISSLVQVDLVRPGEGLELGEELTRELLRATRILQPLHSESKEDALAAFRTAFVERYGEGCLVPLAESLDEELGIGFERSAIAAADASPLLAGLALVSSGVKPGSPPAPRDRLLARWAAQAMADGRRELSLSEGDLAALSRRDPPPLPAAFAVIATVVAASPSALAAGEYELLILSGGHGPSGAKLLGRFCHGDQRLHRGVVEHLTAEEALDPEALFVEIVHQPGGRIGNVLLRPLLRAHEIVVLARSGAPDDRQIPLDDLLVTVRRETIELRSRRLGKRLLPRLTTAHNAARESLGLYRFLAALQEQGVSGPLGWSWGPSDSLPFLPRVRCGRLILNRARWTVGRDELVALVKAAGGERFRLVAQWRHARRIDRFVYFADSDNRLLVDFDNCLSIDAWLEVAKGRELSMLVELYPGPDQLCAVGPQGRYLHEIVVPFAARPAARPAGSIRPDSVRPASVRMVRSRTFPPGSRWLYLKLYTGTSTADRLLQEVVVPVVRSALQSGLASRWFFLRYADPDWHLRVRLDGDPAGLRTEVLPRLAAECGARFESGELWKLQLDTYEREVERYGGVAAIELVEEIFWRDSEAVSELLLLTAETADAEARWKLTCLGMDTLMADFGLTREARHDLARGMRLGLGRRFETEPLRASLAQRWRRERREIEAMLAGRHNDELIASGASRLAVRGEQLRASVTELRRLEREGRLLVGVVEILRSLVHMFVNRMCRSAGPEHELVLYDFLAQAHASALARERALSGGGAVAPVEVG